MRRSIALVFILILTVSSLMIVKLALAQQSTVYIKATGDVYPIGAPVQRSGDIYSLTDDVYGKIVIEKDNVILDGQGHSVVGGANLYNIDTSSVGIVCEARNNITIRGTTVRFHGSGIQISFSTNCTIASNNITSNEYGVWLYYTSNCTLQSNTIAGSFQDAVWVYHSSNNHMIQNSITEPNEGVIGELIGFKLLTDSNFNLIIDNYIWANSGVYLNSSFGNQILQNNIQSGHGIDLNFSPNNTISNNYVSGIIVSDASDRNVLTKNTIYGMGGVTLNFSSYASVSENHFLTQNLMDGEFEGILNIYGSNLEHFLHTIDTSNNVNGKTIYYLQNKTDLLINSSSYPNSGFIAVINSRNVTIENFAFSNQNEAILLAFTNDSWIQNNAVIRSIHTIRLVGAYNNVVSANTITNNEYGLSLVLSNNNTIQNNSFVNNSWYGIGLDRSSTNRILNNTITGSRYDVIFSHVSVNNEFVSNRFNDQTPYYYELSYLVEVGQPPVASHSPTEEPTLTPTQEPTTFPSSSPTPQQQTGAPRTALPTEVIIIIIVLIAVIVVLAGATLVFYRKTNRKSTVNN